MLVIFELGQLNFLYSVCDQSLSHVRLFATPRAAAHQTPLSMGFSGQEYWSGLPLPSPGDLPEPRIEPVSLISPALAGRFFTVWATREAPQKLVGEGKGWPWGHLAIMPLSAFAHLWNKNSYHFCSLVQRKSIQVICKSSLFSFCQISFSHKSWPLKHITFWVLSITLRLPPASSRHFLSLPGWEF